MIKEEHFDKVRATSNDRKCFERHEIWANIGKFDGWIRLTVTFWPMIYGNVQCALLIVNTPANIKGQPYSHERTYESWNQKWAMSEFWYQQHRPSDRLTIQGRKRDYAPNCTRRRCHDRWRWVGRNAPKREGALKRSQPPCKGKVALGCSAK